MLWLKVMLWLRGKKRNIILVGPANCGETFLFAPLQHMFKTFSNPSNDKYTWQEADDCQVMFLNDFRWTPQMIPWSDLQLLLKVQPVRFLTPKNHRASDVLLKKLVPIFATGISEIKQLGAYNKEWERETKMMSVQWNVFKMSRQIPAEDVENLSPCPRCFSKLILLGEQNV